MINILQKYLHMLSLKKVNPFKNNTMILKELHQDLIPRAPREALLLLKGIIGIEREGGLSL
jgi:hypothetical protein